LRENNAPVFADGVDRPLHNQTSKTSRAVPRSDLLAFVHQQREWKVVALPELQVARGSTGVDAENGNAAFGEGVPVVA